MSNGNGDWRWGFVVMALGGPVAWSGARLIHYGFTSGQWPEVPGRVTRCEIRTVQVKRNQQRHSLDFEYEYRVNGETLRGTMIFSGAMSSGTPDSLAPYLQKYPVGATVRVYHHPTRPKVALLEHGVCGSAFFIFAVGMLFFGMGVFVLLRGRGSPWNS